MHTNDGISQNIFACYSSALQQNKETVQQKCASNDYFLFSKQTSLPSVNTHQVNKWSLIIHLSRINPPRFLEINACLKEKHDTHLYECLRFIYGTTFFLLLTCCDDSKRSRVRAFAVSKVFAIVFPLAFPEWNTHQEFSSPPIVRAPGKAGWGCVDV